MMPQNHIFYKSSVVNAQNCPKSNIASTPIYAQHRAEEANMSLKCNIICWMGIFLFVARELIRLRKCCSPKRSIPRNRLVRSSSPMSRNSTEQIGRAIHIFSNSNIDGDTLQLTVSYSGGCEEHEFKLVAWNYFLESNPVQAHVLLAHNANGDLCRGGSRKSCTSTCHR